MIDTTFEKRIVYGSYARKSSESEDRQVQSIETQVEHLLELQHKENLNVYQVPIEERKSAFSPGREGFTELVKWTYQGKVNAWLCYHANRLSRNPIDAGTVIYLMDIGKLDHIRTPTSVYRNNPTDKMMLQFEFMMSKKSSDDKSVFVKDGLNRRYKKGLPTGKAPIGYLNDKSKDKGDRGWLMDAKRLDKVSLILKRFLKGQDSIYSITRYARNVLHLRTVKGKRQGGAYITESGVERLLKSPVYAGFFYSLDENGVTKTKRVLDESLPRLITYAEHVKICSLLGNKSSPKQQAHKTNYTGFIKASDGAFVGADHKFQLICDCKAKFAYRSRSHCPQCKVAIKNIKQPTYLSYTYYYNVRRSKNRAVKTKRIEEKKVDAFLNTYLKNNMAINTGLYQWSSMYVKELTLLSDKEQEKATKAIEDEKASVFKKLGKLKEMYLEEMLGKDEYQKEYDQLQLQLERLSETERGSNNAQKAFEETLNRIADIENIIKNGSGEHKKGLLAHLGSNLVWDEKNLNIYKPKWLIEFEKVRKLMLEKYPVFEPKKDVRNKGDYSDFGTLCPTLLGYWRNVRTLFFEHYK